MEYHIGNLYTKYKFGFVMTLQKKKESQCKKKKGKNYDRKFENIYKHFHLRMQEAKSLKKYVILANLAGSFKIILL